MPQQHTDVMGALLHKPSAHPPRAAVSESDKAVLVRHARCFFRPPVLHGLRGACAEGHPLACFAAQKLKIQRDKLKQFQKRVRHGAWARSSQAAPLIRLPTRAACSWRA